MPIITITDLADPRLADYAHLTDVALKKARGSEHGLYLAESLLVMERALRAGHNPRSVLALGGSVDDAVAAVGDRDIPIFVGPGELLEELTGYVLHRGLSRRCTVPRCRPWSPCWRVPERRVRVAPRKPAALHESVALHEPAARVA